jgi:hypothetical protein
MCLVANEREDWSEVLGNIMICVCQEPTFCLLFLIITDGEKQDLGADLELKLNKAVNKQRCASQNFPFKMACTIHELVFLTCRINMCSIKEKFRDL